MKVKNILFILLLGSEASILAMDAPETFSPKSEPESQLIVNYLKMITRGNLPAGYHNFSKKEQIKILPEILAKIDKLHWSYRHNYNLRPWKTALWLNEQPNIKDPHNVQKLLRQHAETSIKKLVEVTDLDKNIKEHIKRTKFFYELMFKSAPWQRFSWWPEVIDLPEVTKEAPFINHMVNTIIRLSNGKETKDLYRLNDVNLALLYIRYITNNLQDSPTIRTVIKEVLSKFPNI